ncbi:hypothetical protein HYV86_00750 [Candidatus Woesearchaeota archaeon]|nr:hypothetical protein [Candidatus Woesearchaeota archaeon]
MNEKDECLAELCGILAGDGHLSRSISPQRTTYKVSVFGHKIDDKEYFDEIQKKFEKNLGKKPSIKERIECIELRYTSKIILEQFENLGIPVAINRKLFLFLNGLKKT